MSRAPASGGPISLPGSRLSIAPSSVRTGRFTLMKPNPLLTAFLITGAISTLAATVAHAHDATAVRADTSGNLLTPLNVGSPKITGTLAVSHLGTGTPTGSTVLRGDGTWAATTPTGATIASTGDVLMGDGAGNAVGISSGADLSRVLRTRLESVQAATTPPVNLLPTSFDGSAGLRPGNVVNADGTMTVPANGTLEWTLYGGTSAQPVYGYVVATADAPAGALVMHGNSGADFAGTDSTLLPGVYRSAFTAPAQSSLYVYNVFVRNTTAAAITIYYPVLATQDTGLALIQSYADDTAVAVQPILDLNFGVFSSADRSGRYLAERQTTVAADSVNGNNANAGTLYAPKITLQQTVTNGSVFGLYRGSLFRDSLPFSALGTTHGLVARDVALGSVKALPIVSGLDPVNNAGILNNGDGTYSIQWNGESGVANDGYANVYVVEVNTATEANAPIASRRRMTDVASSAAVASTPGSVYVTSFGNGWLGQFRPSDSLAPGAGTYRYEVVSRVQPVNFGAPNNPGDGAASGLELVGGSSGYGSLGGPTGFAGDRLVFVHGTTHSAVIGGGSLQRSVFYEGGDLTSQGPGIQLAWYAGTATGLRWNLDDCLFYANVGDRVPNCVISHSGGATNFDRGDIARCAFLGTRRANGALQGTAIDYNNVNAGVIESVYVQTIANIFGYNMPLATEVKNSVFREVANVRLGLNFHDNLALAESAQDPASNANAPAALLLQANGASAVNNLLWAHGLGGYTQGSSDQAGGIYTNGMTSATIQRNVIILDPANQIIPSIYVALPPGAPTGFAIDYNLVISTARGGVNTLGGVGNASGWAQYRANYPALDAHSLFVDLSADPRGLQAVFVDPLNGDFRWAQTDLARRCAAYCRANNVGPARVTTRWPVVPTVDEAVRLITDL